jgi:hypothetical protein
LEDVIPSEVVEACVLRLVNATTIQLTRVDTREWVCLNFLANERCYSRAKQMLSLLAGKNVCSMMLGCCGGLITGSRHAEERAYLIKFLAHFVDRSGDRQGMVYNAYQLRGALLSYLTERFADSTCTTQTDVLLVVSSVVTLFQSAGRHYDAVELLREGALHAIKCATLHIFGLPAPQDKAELHRLDLAVCSLWSMFTIILRVRSGQRVLLNADMYQLSRNDVYRITVAVYGLIPIFRGNPIRQFSTFVTDCGAYIRKVWGTDALRSYLLYKPPRNEACTKPIVLLMAEWAIESGEAHSEFAVMKPLRKFARAIPQVADVLRALPAPPERVVKDRQCAYPDCIVTGSGLYTNIKKCNRCKAVYYCSKFHQEDHWPEHRLTCVKAVNPVEPDGGN